jgi:hypothetical protein
MYNSRNAAAGTRQPERRALQPEGLIGGPGEAFRTPLDLVSLLVQAGRFLLQRPFRLLIDEMLHQQSVALCPCPELECFR